MSRIDDLNKVLANLRSSSGDVEACAVVSEDGLIIASALQQGVDEARIAAMSAAMLSLGERITAELKRGALEQLYVKGSDGYVIVVHAGQHAELLTMTRKEAKLGLIFLELARAAEEIRAILA